MNTYRAIHTAGGRWAVEWASGGQLQGVLVGTFPSEEEALFQVYELARLEYAEGGSTPEGQSTANE